MTAPASATPLARLSDAVAQHLVVLGDALDGGMLAYRKEQLTRTYERLWQALVEAREASRLEARRSVAPEPGLTGSQPSGMVWDAVGVARTFQRAAEAVNDSDEAEESA